MDPNEEGKGGKTDVTSLVKLSSVEYLSKLRLTNGSDAQSVHDLPKLVGSLGGGWLGYSKKLIPVMDEDQKDDDECFPPRISDWISVGTFPSPFKTNPAHYSLGGSFVSDTETILVDIIAHQRRETLSREFLRCGPRDPIAFHPATVKAAIVTCGGLCPGLNTVIRELFNTLKHLYGVDNVWGIPYGYRGFYATNMHHMKLTEEKVAHIHHQGGTILGSSRGGFDLEVILNSIMDFGYNQVYIIGGDGTHRGAIKIFEETRKRGLKISVVGIPKTIDNDIALIDKSFGFDTAVEEAQRAINSAKVEALSGINGVGLVKLMGRSSGYIAMFSTLASRDVNICLIPEVSFCLEGPNGVFQHLQEVLETKGHAVVVVAEGAGMDLLSKEQPTTVVDASGNPKLPDVGLWLKDKINQHFKSQEMEINLKYIDPTYMIRTVPANASDSLYCGLLGQSAVHGAMAGYTGYTVGLINTHFVMIPMPEIANRGRVSVDVTSRMWNRVIATTGQPDFHDHSCERPVSIQRKVTYST
uniref:ATP-dependent 6-phosphofructokinase n=1 Tax=Compsopogon caeruleus TaxID=31354 RepID=A0A7S1TFU7_9RHOD|mmetsp:Transcript_4673/g.9416  ORF Transcript_4673/g.9416 Transcript_4673/m.9416 type:complete len:527 (+) Transcript_4673:73-1653(+)